LTFGPKAEAFQQRILAQWEADNE
ncbi:tRNA (adenosine(37)-N6)-threonylcarbamoyltransferase complex ATPase subunit type 1 TsaE, partial [Escherichia coli]